MLLLDILRIRGSTIALLNDHSTLRRHVECHDFFKIGGFLAVVRWKQPTPYPLNLVQSLLLSILMGFATFVRGLYRVRNSSHEYLLPAEFRWEKESLLTSESFSGT